MVKNINLVLIQHVRVFGGRGRTHSKWGSRGVCVEGEKEHTIWKVREYTLNEGVEKGLVLVLSQQTEKKLMSIIYSTCLIFLYSW